MATSDQARDPYPIRPITEEEFDSYRRVDEHAFHSGPMTAEHLRRFRAMLDLDRTLAAFDPDLGGPVGITCIFSFQVTIPGGAAMPAAAVSWVGVLPTHRRRGVLRSLMRRQLADISAAGREPLAMLWASEATIYGRYGYGAASWHVALEARRGEGTLSPGGARVLAESGVRLRLAEPADTRAELAKVYDTALQSRPGFFGRDDLWWERRLHDPEADRKGASPLRCLLAEDGDGPRGYALYSGIGRWDEADALPTGAVNVRELIAVDAAAAAALWSDLLSRDLTAEFRANDRPVDDPVLSLLADPRRLRPRLTDGLWIRLVDVPRALAARRYSAPADVVIEVRDRELPANAGRWRLTTQPGSGADGLAAVCSPATDVDQADITLDVAQLGAAYLGGTRLGTFAEAGLVTESRPGAVRQLTAAIAWDPAPWCPMVF
jgi:predicted acetyltransferase